MAQAEIITIGDELLIGQVVDTNSAYIGLMLGEIGMPVCRITSIKDDKCEIKKVLTAALERSQTVIVTGGLGPTKDDITKQALAEMFGSRLVRDSETYEHVQEFIERRGIEFNELNKGQADVPECCAVLKNEHGSAPGMMFERNGHLLFSLPGVPFEMKELLKKEVIPAIESHFILKSVVHRTVMTYGMPESILSDTIAKWEDNLPIWLHLAYLPNPRAIRLRLSAYNVEKGVAENEITRQFDQLKSVIPMNLLGYEPASIESSLANLLIEKGATLAVAESCTGGAISSRITALKGCSAYYKGSVTSYANDVKISILGVSKEDMERYGAVSRQVAEQMAVGVKRELNADYAVASTGIAGPDGGTEEKPVGTVWIAIATPEGIYSQKIQLGKLREQNIERATSSALNMLRNHIIGTALKQTATYL